jgi:hypothetical protein
MRNPTWRPLPLWARARAAVVRSEEPRLRHGDLRLRTLTNHRTSAGPRPSYLWRDHAWLGARPSIEIVAKDRGGAIAEPLDAQFAHLGAVGSRLSQRLGNPAMASHTGLPGKIARRHRTREEPTAGRRRAIWDGRRSAIDPGNRSLDADGARHHVRRAFEIGNLR